MRQQINRWPGRLDAMQSASGLLLVLFIWGHMFFESSILLGKDAMYWVTRMFEGAHLLDKPYPILVSAVAALVLLLLAAHALLALRKFPADYQQYRRLNQHVGAMRHMDTTLWYVQVITGFVLFFLASAHLLVVMTQPDNIGPYASSDRIWSERFWMIYAPLLLVVHLHAGIGIYRLAMKWGPFPAETAGLWRGRIKLALCCIVAFYLCLGTASLITYMKIGADHSHSAGERYIPARPVEPQ